MGTRIRACRGLMPLVFVIVGVLGVEPVEADCLYADVYVERQGASTVYPVGEDPCLTPTPGTWLLLVGPVDVGHDVPDGAPKRVFVDIRVPLP